MTNHLTPVDLNLPSSTADTHHVRAWVRYSFAFYGIPLTDSEEFVSRIIWDGKDLRALTPIGASAALQVWGLDQGTADLLSRDIIAGVMVWLQDVRRGVLQMLTECVR